MLSRVIARNVGDVFLRHSVVFVGLELHCFKSTFHDFEKIEKESLDSMFTIPCSYSELGSSYYREVKFFVNETIDFILCQ